MKLLTKKELAKEMNIDVKTLDRHYIFKEGFPYIMEGRRKKFPLEEVNEWLRSQIIRG